jgi:nicotinamide-nucleotide amidase
MTHLVEEIINELKKRNLTITCAESCTGGLVASKITQISGSSEVFKGSIITYSNEVKEKELNVKKETMIKYGAVSKEVVSEMLDGVIKKFNSDLAIAISGVAGPTGGTKNKPIGTVIVGIIGFDKKKSINIFHFKGDRIGVQEQSCKKSLEIIANSVNKA